MAKKTYKIPVSWQMYGYVETEAETLQDAINFAHSENCPLPKGDYVDSSFEVDGQILENDYPDEKFNPDGTEI